jgi:F-type H+-transporting ATPase subunit delta
MKRQILVKHYAQGLIGALRDDLEFRQIAREIDAFHGLFSSRRDLGEVMANPFVAAKKKSRIIKDILAASSFSQKTSRFLTLLHGHNRLDLLGEILQSLPLFWNERQGVATFEVSSVVALSEVQKLKLAEELERLEKRPVSLNYRVTPELVAGISLKKGNLVYDASFRGYLSKLKEKIIEG